MLHTYPHAIRMFILLIMYDFKHVILGTLAWQLIETTDVLPNLRYECSWCTCDVVCSLVIGSIISCDYGCVMIGDRMYIACGSGGTDLSYNDVFCLSTGQFS